jgi:hypothetical protein
MRVNHSGEIPSGSFQRLRGVANWLAFSVFFALWLFWAYLLTGGYIVFGFEKNRDEYIWMGLTYALDPIALLIWFKELRRDRMRPFAVLFVAIVVVLNVWQHA